MFDFLIRDTLIIGVVIVIASLGCLTCKVKAIRQLNVVGGI